MARYRMNDLLWLSRAPCPCGSPLLAVDEVVGRMDDVFEFDGGAIKITPDILRNVVLDSDRAITDFRLVQLSDAQVRLSVPPTVSQDRAQRARVAVQGLLDRFGGQASVVVQRAALPIDPTRKLRRVERRKARDE